MNVISPPTRQLLALSMLTGVGPAALRKVAALARSEQFDIQKLSAQIPALARATEDATAWDIAQDHAEKQIDEARKYDARILSPEDAEYPRLLSSTKDDPFLLYVRGNLAPNPDQSVAVIGTREPTQHGQLIATRITQFFADNRWSVVSGLAIGCDAIAHQSALDAGGHTVAVLAHGLQTIAPARHRKLAEDILSAGGALVSEYPFGREVQRQQYVKRDRTQAGMAQGVVMIQSDLIGGSLHASRAALDYGRWLAAPYPTSRDRDRNEPKIQANLVIAEGSDAQRSELLRCTVNALRRVIVLSSKDDYLLMTKSPGANSGDGTQTHHHPGQTPSEQSILSNQAEKEERSAGVMMPAEAQEEPFIGLKISQHPSSDTSLNDAQPAENASWFQASHSADTSGKEALQLAPHDAITGHLKILGLPTANLAKSSTVSALIEQTPVALALSALLDYLQIRLDAVDVARKQSKYASNKDGRQFFHLAIDDALAQMKRAADFLLALESFQYREMNHGLSNNGATARSWAHQIRLLTDLGRDELRQREPTFFTTLDHLQNSSLHRLLLASCDWNELREIDRGDSATQPEAIQLTEAVADMQSANVYLENLVGDFNRLVRRALYA